MALDLLFLAVNLAGFWIAAGWFAERRFPFPLWGLVSLWCAFVGLRIAVEMVA